MQHAIALADLDARQPQPPRAAANLRAKVHRIGQIPHINTCAAVDQRCHLDASLVQIPRRAVRIIIIAEHGDRFT